MIVKSWRSLTGLDLDGDERGLEGEECPKFFIEEARGSGEDEIVSVGGILVSGLSSRVYYLRNAAHIVCLIACSSSEALGRQQYTSRAGPGLGIYR